MGFLSDSKDIYELFRKAGNVEAQEKIMALREEHLRLKEECLQLREDNQHLKSRIETEASYRFESPYYWKIASDGNEEGPYCQVCKDGSGKGIRLQPRSSSRGWWDCKNCGHHLIDSNYRDNSGNTVIRQDYDWMSV